MESGGHLEIPCSIVDTVRRRKVFWELEGESANWAPHNQGLFNLAFVNVFVDKLKNLLNITVFFYKLGLQGFLNSLIRLVNISWQNLRTIFRLDVSKSCELIEMSPESIPWVVQGFIASTDEASALNYAVSIVECWGSEVLIVRMNFKSFKRIYWSDSVLPDVTNDVVKPLGLEHVDRIRW